MPTKTLLELEKSLRAVSRLRARLTQINQHKLPIYWSLQPRVFEALRALESALKADAKELQVCTRENR